jgi:prepilin-type N-terminal cleavage/methylation domain-containing protein
MIKKLKIFPKGLTLIELMVSILVIALLITIGMVAMKNAQAKARDAKRVYDLQQYAKALRLYAQASATGAYPQTSGYLGRKYDTELNNELKNYIPDLPSDPKDIKESETGNYFYYYIPNNNCSGGNFPTLHTVNIETSNADYYQNDCTDGSAEQGANIADYLIIIR